MKLDKQNIKDIIVSFELNNTDYPTIVISAIDKDSKIFILGSCANKDGSVSIKHLIKTNNYETFKLQ